MGIPYQETEAVVNTIVFGKKITEQKKSSY